jgi:hypothetical protein
MNSFDYSLDERLTHREIGFFQNHNLDRNIITLRKSLNHDSVQIEQSINERMPAIQLEPNNIRRKRNSINFPSLNSSCLLRKQDVKSRRNSSCDSLVLLKKDIVMPNPVERLDSNTRFLYNKIFKNREIKKAKILPMTISNTIHKKDENIQRIEDRKINIEKKIKLLKSKVLFIKGVYDYAYPKIIVEKLKAMKGVYIKQPTGNWDERFISKREHNVCKVYSNYKGASLPNSPERKINSTIDNSKKTSRAIKFMSNISPETTSVISLNKSSSVSFLNRKL